MSNVRGRPFQPGNQYGRGRPKGSRNKSTPAAQQLLEQYSEPIMRKCIAQALGGDVRALKLCLERVTPVRRNSLVKVNLPAIESAKDLGAVNQKDPGGCEERQNNSIRRRELRQYCGKIPPWIRDDRAQGSFRSIGAY